VTLFCYDYMVITHTLQTEKAET